MTTKKDLPNQTQGNLAAAIILSIPVLGWFISPFVLIILLTRANTLSDRRGRDMLLLLIAAAIYSVLVGFMLNLKGDSMAEGTIKIMGMQVIALFLIFCTLSRNFKVWAVKGENSPWSS
ncbi:hypothetical protein IFT43_05665 [Oxalobacteraceae sp. CFBP 13708]|nr:hypothetical protein [Oxalobacteraceae sp. CFBP 13708]